jgi:acyl carrier protein
MDYKQEIRGYVAEHFLPGGQGLEDTTPLISGGLIDSIGMLGLISFMESRFGVEFMPREVDAHTLDNVNLIAALIDRKLAAKAS